MIKKISMIVLTVLSVVVLVACDNTKYTVTFDSNGGTPATTEKVVAKGKKVEMPNDPVKENYVFAGWYDNEELDGDAYNPDTPVTKNFTLYADWFLDQKDGQYVRFVDHRQNTTVLIAANDAGKVAKPNDPTRSGYRFGGWFSSKRGLTWNDMNPFDFDSEVPVGGVSVYAYWEPVDSAKQNWSDGETYFSTLSSDSTYVFNPLTYEYSTELDIIRYMATSLYVNEVDWGKAIADRIADFPGDFSKFGTGEGKYGIDLLKNHYVLAGAAAYPKNQNGHDLVDEDGNWDPDAASDFLDTVWVVEIRDDLKFEDGTPITAEDYVYAYSQYIDPLQNNKRGSTMFPTQDRKNGYPIVNARSYFLTPDSELFDYEVEEGYFTGEVVDGKIGMDQVGFKAIDDYKVELTFERAVAQTSAVGLMNNVYLLHREKYEASLDAAREKSNYGTALSPYVSYGGYVMKSWDENAKIVYNKNYDYVLKHTINYKSISYQLTEGIDENMQLFEAGKLSAVGLQGEYAAEYAEWPNNYPTYQGFPVSLDVNMTDALDGSRPANPVMLDINFRKAVLYGFDRQEFANTLFAPNTASILIWPIEAKQYTGDEFWYKDTPEHKAILEMLDINEDTAGFDAAKAVQYFNLAYNKWVADGNSGAIQIDFITYTGTTYEGYANYIKQSYEQLFGADKIKVNVDHLDDTVLWARQDNRAFDWTLDVGGWGFADATFAYMPLKGLYYDLVFGPGSGMNDVFSIPGLAEATVYEPLDLNNTLAFLESTKYEQEEDEDTPSGFWDETTSRGSTLELYELLLENDGIFDGELLDLFMFVLNDSFMWWKDEEPYAGAVEDLTKISAAFEYAILDLVTLVPIGSRTSIVAYADNVVIEWPEYSYELGWGAARYRHLNTDPDFQ